MDAVMTSSSVSSFSSSAMLLRRPPSSPRINFLLILPLAVSVSVVTYLPLPSVASCSAVNALLFALCQDDRVWRQLCSSRWRPLQHARTALLTSSEWTALYGDDEDGEAEEETEAGSSGSSGSERGKRRGQRSVSGGEEAPKPGNKQRLDDSGSSLLAVSWKERYISAELDLCRSYMTLSEVTEARWAFRFLPNVFFDDRSATTYPVFTPSRLITGLDMTYDWRFVDAERDTPARARERGEMTVYERRRLVTGEQIATVRAANRPYWLRSSGTDTPPLPSTRHVEWNSQPNGAGQQPLLSASSALLSPSLPPYRFPPSHPFFRLSELQLADCSTERRLQVSHFPALSISRLPDGGWQMLNQYVLFKSLHPDDSQPTRQQQQHDDDDDEEVSDDEEEEAAADREDDDEGDYHAEEEEEAGADDDRGNHNEEEVEGSHRHSTRRPSDSDERMHCTSRDSNP